MAMELSLWGNSVLYYNHFYSDVFSHHLYNKMDLATSYFKGIRGHRSKFLNFNLCP